MRLFACVILFEDIEFAVDGEFSVISSLYVTNAMELLLWVCYCIVDDENAIVMLSM